MKGKDLANGINMIKYCRAHEAYIDERLAAGDDPAALLAWHMQKLMWVQHERLIHLLVTILTAIGFLFALFMWVYLDYNVGVSFFALGLLVLLGFYLVHYFRLENTVQHWYTIAEELHARCGVPVNCKEEE